MDFEYNKTKTGFINHKGEEIRVGDIVDQGGTKDYLILEVNGWIIMNNFEHGDLPLDFYFDNDDNEFNIKGNIFDDHNLIKLCF